MVEGIGDVLTKYLFARFNDAQDIFRASETDLAQVEGIGSKHIEAIKSFSDWERAEREIEKINKLGLGFIPLNDPKYPESLRQIYNPPPYLYVNGNILPSDSKSIAIVGTRMADRYGRLVAETLSGELASRGITIVSGMARGIDSIAQEEALKRGGRTIAVLGCGVDLLYPPENKKLYNDIVSNGAIVSEFFLGSPPLAHNFPRRNRIISGLSLGVIVVQAAARSGSLITASFALDQNREVFAVPGNVNTNLSRGTNWLIKKGAKLVETVDDILGELELLEGRDQGALFQDVHNESPKLSGDEKTVYSVLNKEPQHIDSLIAQTGLDTSVVLSVLLTLGLEGIISQEPGKMFLLR